MTAGNTSAFTGFFAKHVNQNVDVYYGSITDQILRDECMVLLGKLNHTISCKHCHKLSESNGCWAKKTLIATVHQNKTL